MKNYPFVKFEIKENQLVTALESGLCRSLSEREKRSIKWHSTNDYETSGILLDWFEELSSSLNNAIGVDEAAELWNLSAGYIKNLCAIGKIKSKKIGKTWIIDKNQPNPSKK